MTRTQAFLVLGTLLAILAGAGILATVVVLLSGTDVYGLVMALGGATALFGGVALSSPTTPTTLLPHFILTGAVIGLTIAMGVSKTPSGQPIFTAAMVLGVFYLIVGAGIAGAGGQAIVTKLNAFGQAMKPRSYAHSPGQHPAADPPYTGSGVPVGALATDGAGVKQPWTVPSTDSLGEHPPGAAP